ncbi:MAG: hypothetical protein J5822_07400 [Eubacteriaceae bacterium]|nr:hypothetical protein [Eubacteriaceae bacterium]
MNNIHRYKKLLCILIAFLLHLSTASCGSGSSPQEKQDDPPSEEQSPDPVAEEKPVYDNSQVFGPAVLSDGDSLTGGTYVSEGDNVSAVEASGSVKAEMTGSIINKSAGDASSADDASFRGLNAAVRAYGDSTVTLRDCTVNADAKNATGVFAYENAVIYLYNCEVHVTGGGAGGVQVAGGGTLIGEDLTVTSESKAAIRSDRGGGVMILRGGSYTSRGFNGCPAIYSTADITVSDALCISENSRAVIIEGKNSVKLENCVLSGNDQSTKEGSVRAAVMLYQSASGDAKEGVSVFTMNGGSMTTLTGAMFYCTNTSSVVNLTGTELVLSDTGMLLIVSEGRWGKDGRNGGHCAFNVSDQELSGDIYVDGISSLELRFVNVSYRGAITGEGDISLEMGEGSTWVLTGDSSVGSLLGDTSGIDTNGFVLLVDGEEFSKDN